VWSTVLLMAVIESIDPVRFGLTTYLLSRPRPVRLLIGFFIGGFTSNVVVGLLFLFVFRHVDLGADSWVSPKVEIAIGVVLILAGALVYSGLPARLVQHVKGRRAGAEEEISIEDGPPELDAVPGIGKLPAPIMRVLRADTAAVALGLGLASGWPTPYYFAGIASILLAGPAAGTQVAAIVVFCLVAFSMAAAAIACFLLAPEATRDTVDRAYNWTRAHHRLVLAVVLAVVGLYFVVAGVRHL
jgi:hypothetical protein